MYSQTLLKQACEQSLSVPDVILLALVVSVVAELASPETALDEMAMFVFVTFVTRPMLSTVNTGDMEAEPYVLAFTPEGCKPGSVEGAGSNVGSICGVSCSRSCKSRHRIGCNCNIGIGNTLLDDQRYQP